MSHLIIKAAFETRLATWAAAQSPPLPVAFENDDFQPTTGTFVAGFLVPAETVSLTLDQTHRQYKGLYQVSIYGEVDVGTGYLIGLAESLDTIFSPASPLVQSLIKIYVTRPMSLGPAIQDGGHFILPVSFEYHLDVV